MIGSGVKVIGGGVRVGIIRKGVKSQRIGMRGTMGEGRTAGIGRRIVDQSTVGARRGNIRILMIGGQVHDGKKTKSKVFHVMSSNVRIVEEQREREER